MRAWLAAEIYLMDGDGTNLRRLTENTYADGFPSLSPDGTRIVFDSNRLRAEGEPFNTSDLFVMNADGTGQNPRVSTRFRTGARAAAEGRPRRTPAIVSPLRFTSN